MDIFSFLYQTREADRRLFGDKYQPPDIFPHGDWARVAVFEKDPDNGDGSPCEIWESRYPAQFFQLRVAASTNSVGEPKEPFTLSTGSGTEMGKLIFAIADAVSQGMIGLREPGED